MEGHTSELMGLAEVALMALFCGIVTTKLRQPALVGYILAGVLLGPSVLGVVESAEAIALLAELGVLLLLYVIGMELSLRAFRSVLRAAVVCTGLQVLGSVALMLLVSWLLGWSPKVGVLFGFLLALSSTAVAIKILDEIGELRTRIGRITVGVLIAQDIAVVPMMLIVANLAGRGIGLDVLFKVLLAVGLMAVVVWYLSRRQRVHLPFAGIAVGNVDLTPLTGLTYCFGAAALTGWFGLSPAYGAFVAGLVIGNSAERQTMLETVQPIQSVLIMVFFVSIGMLLDLVYLWDNIGAVLLLMVVVMVFKTALNVGVLRLVGVPRTDAFLGGVALSQVGEFSFLLAGIGASVALISDADFRLVVAVTVLSLIASPFWLDLSRRAERLARPGAAPALPQPRDNLLTSMSLFADEVTRKLAGHPDWDEELDGPKADGEADGEAQDARLEDAASRRPPAGDGASDAGQRPGAP